MSFVKIICADVKGRQFGQRRWGAQTALLNILYLVVGYQVLGNTTNGEGKGLLHEAIAFEFVTVRQATDENTFAMPVYAS